MKVLTVPTAKRLQYLAQALESIRRNNVKGYVLYVGAEPLTDETVKIAEAVDFMPVKVIRNPTVYGVRWNAYHLAERAVEDGAEYIVALEEDIIITPDALDLVEWYWNLPTRDEYVCLSLLHRFCDSEEPLGDPKRALALCELSGFANLGYCFTAESWKRHFRPVWGEDKKGWDWSVLAYITRNNLKTLVPRLGRATHIGREGGVHCTAKIHDRMFSKLVISDGSFRSGFFIEKKLP